MGSSSRSMGPRGNGDPWGRWCDDGRGGSERLGRDVPRFKQLQEACSRLLDALWISSAQGSDTLSLRVEDAREVLSGLMAMGIGDPDTVLPVPTEGGLMTDTSASMRDSSQGLGMGGMRGTYRQDSWRWDERGSCEVPSLRGTRSPSPEGDGSNLGVLNMEAREADQRRDTARGLGPGPVPNPGPGPHPDPGAGSNVSMNHSEAGSGGQSGVSPAGSSPGGEGESISDSGSYPAPEDDAEKDSLADWFSAPYRDRSGGPPIRHSRKWADLHRKLHDEGQGESGGDRSGSRADSFSSGGDGEEGGEDSDDAPAKTSPPTPVSRKGDGKVEVSDERDLDAGVGVVESAAEGAGERGRVRRQGRRVSTRGVQ
ncbi:unnamed protein product [Discosporangium mesarthrocarpum]